MIARMMRSPALDSLDSREIPYILRKDKKLRYKEAIRVGVDGDLSDKSRFYHFSVALVKYGHSDLVRRVASRITTRLAPASHELTPTRPQGPPPI